MSIMNNNCPNCGCNPQDAPYCMTATHCPKCGYIFKTNFNDLMECLKMKNERKIELLNTMLEYLKNYGVELEDIGVYDNTKDDELYDICLGYIVNLVGNNGDKHFFEHVLGFTKEELIAEGMKS